jgi:hypothetical protein
MFTTDEINELNGLEVRACIETAIERLGETAEFESVMALAEQLWREGSNDR